MLSTNRLTSIFCQAMLFLPISVLPVMAQADLSISLPENPGQAFKTQVTPHAGYSATREIDSATSTRIHLKKSNPTTSGEGTLEYQSTRDENSSRLKWSGHSREVNTSGAPATPGAAFPPGFPMPQMPALPQIPMPVPPSPFPMKMEFPMPPIPFQALPVPPGFPQSCPPAMPQSPAHPGLAMPPIPAQARTVTSATGTGDIDYSQSPDGRNRSLKWSNSSSVSTSTAWPPHTQGASAPKSNTHKGTRNR